MKTRTTLLLPNDRRIRHEHQNAIVGKQYKSQNCARVNGMNVCDPIEIIGSPIEECNTCGNHV